MLCLFFFSSRRRHTRLQGDWSSDVCSSDLYVDSHYRTLATRDSRGLTGHSMGGYGALRIGMKHPDVFGSVYVMSACCLARSEERRVGKEWRYRWRACDEN